MDSIGLDLHARESQLCILTEEGELVELRIRTSRERFLTVLGARPRARLLLEASTGSEWVARYLEELGHEVIVADPNFAPMYATRSRRVKTDRRDARTLAEAARLGACRPAHRASDGARQPLRRLAQREAVGSLPLLGVLAPDPDRIAPGRREGHRRYGDRRLELCVASRKH